MSGGDWPANPMDPRCPECSEPVSASASYCLHCYADLPAEGAVETAVVDLGSGSEDDVGGAGAAADRTRRHVPPADSGRDEPLAGLGTDERSVGFGKEEQPAGPATGEQPTWIENLLPPDSTLDDVSTGIVGIVGGLLAGVLAAPISVWLLPDPLESGVAPATIGSLFAATVWIAHTQTVFGAVRKAGFLLGGLVALVPIAVTIAIADPDALFLGVFLWPVALVVAAVGWLAGHGAVEA